MDMMPAPGLCDVLFLMTPAVVQALSKTCSSMRQAAEKTRVDTEFWTSSLSAAVNANGYKMPAESLEYFRSISKEITRPYQEELRSFHANLRETFGTQTNYITKNQAKSAAARSTKKERPVKRITTADRLRDTYYRFLAFIHTGVYKVINSRFLVEIVLSGYHELSHLAPAIQRTYKFDLAETIYGDDPVIRGTVLCRIIDDRCSSVSVWVLTRGKISPERLHEAIVSAANCRLWEVFTILLRSASFADIIEQNTVFYGFDVVHVCTQLLDNAPRYVERVCWGTIFSFRDGHLLLERVFLNSIVSPTSLECILEHVKSRETEQKLQSRRIHIEMLARTDNIDILKKYMEICDMVTPRAAAITQCRSYETFKWIVNNYTIGAVPRDLDHVRASWIIRLVGENEM